MVNSNLDHIPFPDVNRKEQIIEYSTAKLHSLPIIRNSEVEIDPIIYKTTFEIGIVNS